MSRTKNVLVSIVLTVLGVLVSGCDKDKTKTTETLEGTYFTEEKQYADGSYEPAMVFTFDKEGNVLMETIYPARNNGQAFKETFKARYSLNGSRFQLSNVQTVKACSTDSQTPFGFDVNYRHEGDNIVLFGNDNEAYTLKPATHLQIKGFAATLNCDKAQQTVNNEPPKPQDPQAPAPTAPQQGGQNQQGKGVLPADIPPVTVGPMGSPKNKNNETLPYIAVPRAEQVDLVVDAAKVECLKTKECPAYVGLLIGKRFEDGTNYLYQCSTTYLGNGYFSTNSHCYFNRIPKGRRTYESLCAGRLWVKLPATGSYKEETLNCERVIHLTMLYDKELKENIGRESLDVMIFKVKETISRPAAQVDFTAQVAVGDVLTAWTVNPVHSKPGINGEIEMKQCTANDPRNMQQWSEIEPTLKNKTYTNIFLDKCTKDIRRGNSGSSFFNDKGKAVMIVSNIYAEKEEDVSSARGYGSKYACMDQVNDDQDHVFTDSTRSQCFSLSTEDVDTLTNNIKVRKHNQVVSEINEIKDKLKLLKSYVSLAPEQKMNSKISDSALRDASDAFTGWRWIRAVGKNQPANIISYFPTQEYDKAAVGADRVGAKGEILFNVNDYEETYFESFYTFDISVPSCMNVSKLTRKETNDFWDILGARKYSYSPVEIPIHAVYKSLQSVLPQVINGPLEISQLRLDDGPRRVSELHYKIILKLGDGSDRKVDFSPQVNFDKNPEAKAIADYLQNVMNASDNCPK